MDVPRFNDNTKKTFRPRSFILPFFNKIANNSTKIASKFIFISMAKELFSFPNVGAELNFVYFIMGLHIAI